MPAKCCAEVAESPRASLQSWFYAGSNPALGSIFLARGTGGGESAVTPGARLSLHAAVKTSDNVRHGRFQLPPNEELERSRDG